MATHFILDALDAAKGDALVLRWGKGTKRHLALIDGGPDSVYDRSIQPHLAALAGANPAGKPNPVVLDLVVVSHVDDDHIQGIIDLANAVDRAQKQAEAVPAQIDQVWHNAFADMQFLAEFSGEPDLQQAIKDADAKPASLISPGATPREDPSVGDITAGAQNVRQGRELDRILRTINLPKNVSFGDRDGFARDGAPIKLHGLRITVLAPNTDLLELLRAEWKRELKKILEKEADKKKAGVSALAAAFDDPSVPNQSSIVLLVEFEGRSMLLTGDARGDHLIAALKKDHSPADPLRVDLFKVPHHGSARSNGKALFELVRADHYVISGNGDHGNPHADAIKALLATTKGRPVTLHLTNRPASGAKKPLDKKKAKAAQKALDAAESNPDVTIVYRDPADLAVTVELR
jgi:beta-lactamase superfamily II metal-dependent hydrolase